ncbi:Golgi-associated plant pathogenesis-related protein 1 [Halotydeus destructor]|nr:Golgi-associated plant pathogenesis-related protein 1 [Halotydeus destructor]
MFAHFVLASAISVSFFHSTATAQECLSEHNKYRSLHGVPSLKYDSRLEKFAVKRAQYMAATDIFAHPSNLQYGENLYWRSGRVPSCASALDMWYREIKWYNFPKGKFSHKTGHFTQMVWKDTRYLGCASAKSKRTGRIYIACNYYPAGNVMGRFVDNVPNVHSKYYYY